MLQGSLDNFALDEVLGLLSSTSKTGHLRLDGDRGSGVLTLCDGKLVAAEASCATDASPLEDVVFELLRFERGEFVFDPVDVEPGPERRDVSQVLAAAEARLVDWRTIEAVVPSVDHVVTPVPILPAEDVKINRAEWATLVLIGAGAPVAAVCDRLEVGELEGSRQIKALVERGLVAVVEVEAAPPPPLSPSRSLAPLPAAPPARAVPPAPVLEPGPVMGEPPFAPSSSLAAAPPIRSASSSLLQPPAPRPPMPPAPAAEDLAPSLSSVAPGPPTPAPASAPATAGDPVVDDGRPGGLLMRYLNSDD